MVTVKFARKIDLPHGHLVPTPITPALRKIITEARALVTPDDLPDTAPKGRQARELSDFYNIDHPGWNLSPASLLAAFVDAENGYPRTQCLMFNDIVKNDAHLLSLMLQRRQAVAGKPWLIQGTEQNKDSALASRVLTRVLGSDSMIQVFEHLLDFNRYGYAAVEIEWGVARIEGRLWVVPTRFFLVKATSFLIGDPMATTGAVDELRIMTSATDARGSQLVPGKWIVIDRADPTLAEGALMRTAAWPAMGKRFAFRDWLIFSEKFGIPLITASYEGESDDKLLKETATKIVQGMGGEGGAVIPKSIEVEIVEAGRTSDNSAAHGGLISFANSEMSKLINGSTLSSDNSGTGGASYALGNIHNNVRWDNVIYDAARLTAGMRSQLFAPFMRFNGLDPYDAPRLHIQVVRDETPMQRIAIAEGMQRLGVPVMPSQLHQETGFNAPKPGSDDATDPSFATKKVNQPTP